MVDMMSSRSIMGRGDNLLLSLQQPWRKKGHLLVQRQSATRSIAKIFATLPPWCCEQHQCLKALVSIPLFEFLRDLFGCRKVSVLVEMLDTVDFLDSLLAKWFGASDYSNSQTSGLPTAPSCEHSFVDLVADFALSLLQPSSSNLPASSGEPTLFVPRRDCAINFDIEVKFEGQMEVRPFSSMRTPIFTADLKRAGSFTSKITCGKMVFVTLER